MSELKPCPECGSDDLNIMTEYTSGNRVIHCTGCHKYYDHLKLTREDTLSDIFERWNEYAQNYKPKPKTESVLKPCPFCGSEELVFADEEDGSCCIRCTDCGAQVGHYRDYMSDNEDIAGLWNRRASE
ncbi:Lar family restriction alleviation protein [Methanomassiliicoccales archaeon LGM-RCC1]|nr:Lar family restriction alleviation protein [Methanomassiliicoccales archaeon LGM-RCC1]